MPDQVAGDQLKSLIQRIERLEEEKKALTSDISEVYSEAKGAGFDTKCMREVIKLRRMDTNERNEIEAVVDLYKVALGMA